jgi:capsular polysaccharide biosynthesis protein
MTLRHYEGDTVSIGGMRLRTEDTILPESFRWPHAKTLRHPHYDSVTPRFVRLDRRKPEEVLDGDFYYVDCLFSGHFGHLTTEVLCRLWGWERARKEIPELKLLFHTNRARGADGRLERRLFTAYGISGSRLVSTDRPVLLRSVTGASPMWHNKSPFYVHPDIRETWARLTSGLLGDAAPSPHERIFVSRGPSLSRRRGCRNQQELEGFFADRGFHVFFPEELPLAEQARLFAQARVVAGFGGSAMFNLMHCRRLEAAVVVSHHAYVARNEHLFTSVLGGQLHYFWQTSDVPPPDVGRNKASSGSSFAFDFQAYGDDLARVLAQL